MLTTELKNGKSIEKTAMKYVGWFLLMIVALAGCGSAEPSFVRGELVYENPAETDRLTSDAQRYVWALTDYGGGDVWIEAQTRLVTDTPNIGTGVGCRMNADGAGYYFVVSRDGYYAILVGTAQSISNLTEWSFSEVIATGAGAENDLQAVCAGEGLSFSVNDTLLATATSNTHDAGAVGMIASGGVEGRSEVTFASLAVYEPEVTN